ncbi:MAG TPA: hypothetical protein VKT73_15370 [Xanthobacteraceae bacterium]|nr:hypothetical protein [Xanthobacteraceae bacterium]
MSDDEIEVLRQQLRDLRAALNQNNQTIANTFRLSPAQNNLFGLLISLDTVTPEIIRQRLEIATDAKVAVHRLRRHLKEWEIQIHSRRNVGYWLDEETKEKIRGMITPQVTESETKPSVAA